MRRWALGIGALAIAATVWVLWPASEAGPKASRVVHSERGLTRDHARPDSDSVPASPPGTRPVVVDVVGCRHRPAEGVVVLAQIGTLQLSARTNDAGTARIAVPEGSREATVRVRIGGRETPPVPAKGDRAEVATCAGATVVGHVYDELGAPQLGLSVQLVDASQAIVDEIEVDAEGHFEVSDAMLDGVALTVQTPGGLETRPLTPLAPAEARTVDVVIGKLHEVVGWVLDMEGEPQPGVAVTMRAQAQGSVWATTTDSKGGFRFGHAPQAPVRIDADGGELGRSSVRLAGSAAKREVSLTLEPVGEITVLASDADGKTVDGTVLVRCDAGKYYGEDPLWTDNLDPVPEPEVGADSGMVDESLESTMPHADPELPALMGALEDGLRAFDPSTPEESMKALVRGVVMQFPQLAEDLPASERAGLSQEQLIDAITAKALRDNPAVVDQMAKAAEMVQSGKTLEEALMEAERGHESMMAETSEGAAGAAGPDDEGEDEGEGEPAYSDAGDDPALAPETPETQSLLGADGVAEVDGASDMVDGGDAVDVEPEAAATPWYTPDSDERTIVARGAIAEPIPLRGSFVYTVAVRRADGTERMCGTVLLHPGESLTVSCGVMVEAHVVGRVVDRAGKPVPHLTITAYASTGDQNVTAESDSAGRFELVAKVDVGQTTALEVTDPTVRLAVSTRRNVMLLPGEVQDVGDIVVRAPDEVPEGWMSKPFGGIGGYISLTDTGVFLDNIEPETPLANEGVEPGDEIVMIDGVSAGELSMDDVLERLRGEPGTDIGLRVRTKAGELFEILVTRGLIKPHEEPVVDVEPTIE